MSKHRRAVRLRSLGGRRKRIDLYASLGVPRKFQRARCYALFHRKSIAMAPEDRRFKTLCVALCVLTDESRREIYDRLGWRGLELSERHCAVDVLELDPIVVFDRFFDALDPVTGRPSEDIRQYLLFEASGHDEEEEEEDEIPVVCATKRPPPRRKGGEANSIPPKPPPGVRGVEEGNSRFEQTTWPGQDAWSKVRSINIS